MEYSTEKKYTGLPVVALAGRPNVGKSTLFNRLLGKRRAITDPAPGVTRDPVEAETEILGKPLRLIDTGGFRLERDLASAPRAASAMNAAAAAGAAEELDSLVVEKTLRTVKQADLVVLVLEAGELTAEDEEFINLLRPFGERLIVAVNKTEGGRRKEEAWNFLSLGFEKIYMISAEHGDHIEELRKAIIDSLDFSAVGAAPSEKVFIKIALLGKPNTGKSTLSNRLTSSEASITSGIPGTTRDVVEGAFVWKGRNFRVLDTAGIRRKSKVTENIEYYSVNRAIKTIDSADIVFLVIDAEEGLSDQDKKIAALASEKGRGIILVLNKWDLMPQIKNTFEAVSSRIRFLFGKMEYAPIVSVSAAGGSGVDKLLSTAITVYSQLTKRIETGRLNQALQRWLAESPPPSGPQTRFSVKYAVQSSQNPAAFIFFVSRPRAVSEAYVSYLRNKIRRDLGFSLIPVIIEIRGSSSRRRE
ncbi:MAG: ribosome biogenesis GTPase Der [Treponema sp.]|jgi:GTP-binding protein|nr:ribosome biogenesis GTPase Der [Treponema sp.]